MREAPMASDAGAEIGQEATAFYRHVLHLLGEAGIPFLVGGAYAFHCLTGVNRATKDLDLFILRNDYPHAEETLRQAGYRTELAYPHWLAKIHRDNDFIDLIFSSGNHIAEVDAAWFEHAPSAEVLGMMAKISPAEEMIWSKAFVMERERYDGADIAHLLLRCGEHLDWARLLRRFGANWRLLLSHLTLFGFIYPAQRDRVPAAVIDELLDRLHRETHAAPPDGHVCSGTLLSREQYLPDIEQWGYIDARLAPHGPMSAEEAAHWTRAIRK